MLKTCFRLAAAAAFAVAAMSPAYGQATRTWVSGVGDDANPCSRTAPCKTFAGAISKTAAGGEINCLDPGGFGAVTITKALTINCLYTEGGVLAGGNGIIVNAGANDVVYLRGLDIFGVNPPINGVRFLAGAALHVEDCIIRRFNAANSFGISFRPTTAARLYVSNTTIAENGSAGTGGGIEIRPGVGGSAQATLTGVLIRNNARDGVQSNSADGTINLVIDRSDFSGNQQGLSLVAGANVNRTMLTNSTITNNSIIGMITSGSNTIARVDNTTITGNTQGISAIAPSQLLSYGGNRLDGNPASGAANDGTFTGAVIPRK